MHRLRNRLIGAFLLATLLPLTATIWITTSLLERSLGYATTGELDRLARSLEETARRFYQRERAALREDALAGRLPPTAYHEDGAGAWPEPQRAFWTSGEPERFGLSGPGGDHLDYMRRTAGGVEVYRRELDGLRMRELSTELGHARALVDAAEGRNLERGFTLTLLLLVAAVWLVSLAPLVVLANRISRPIQALTAGLTDFADGDWERRVAPGRDDEVGRAIGAFNRMAGQLRTNRDRLLYLTRMSSWQSLARKTAHELKNSLTPIRLTVEEMVARQPAANRAFTEEAARIVVGEVDTLERRVRAFSEFSREPPIDPEVLDLNVLVRERVALHRPAHSDTVWELDLDASTPRAWAGADLVKGILTNLLENAAEAAGPDGRVLARTRALGSRVALEVHDSGPGLSDAAAATLFEPTITFKRHGMGLGLSIARKHALLSGGDITVVEGRLGGAAFSVDLPAPTETTA